MNFHYVTDEFPINTHQTFAHVYAQVAGDAAVTALQEQLAASCKVNGGGAPFEPKVGGYCVAQFTVDNEWYRAKVTARGATEYTVFFLDYGNSDTVKKDRCVR